MFFFNVVSYTAIIFGSVPQIQVVLEYNGLDFGSKISIRGMFWHSQKPRTHDLDTESKDSRLRDPPVNVWEVTMVVVLNMQIIR